MPKSKHINKADRERFNKLSEMGCIVCRNLGYGYSPPEVHHLLTGCGMGQRAPNDKTIALCPAHHRTGGYGVAIHAGQKEFEKRYGTETELLEQTNELLQE